MANMLYFQRHENFLYISALNSFKFLKIQTINYPENSAI